MITRYEYTDPDPEKWRFDPIKLGKVNLIVGASGSGKTRFLNTIFNFGLTVSKGEPSRSGTWEITIEAGEYVYNWEYRGASETPNTIKHELLTRKKVGGTKEILIERSVDAFIFQGTTLPKMNPSAPSVTILKEEPAIKPLYRVFSHIKRIRFDKDPFEKAAGIQIFSPTALQQLQSEPNLENVFALSFTINSNLQFLQQHFQKRYEFVVEFFKEHFPSVEGLEIEKQPGNFYKLFIHEKGVKDRLTLEDLSTGMLKALLIITEITSLPGGCTYMLDEYENSLGVNVIEFLPELLSEYGGDNQFIITSHHPYLINNIPMKNWVVFNRKGSTVRNRTGEDLEKLYGKSKHKAFTQLINDPFYTEVG